MRKALTYFLTLALVVMLVITVGYAMNEPSTAILAAGNFFTNGTISAKEYVYDSNNQRVVSQTVDINEQSAYLFDPFADLAMDPESNLHRAVIGAYCSGLIMHHLGVGEYGDAVCYKGEYVDSTMIYIPCFNNNDTITDISIMNAGEAPAQYTIEFVANNGTRLAHYEPEMDLQPGQTIRPEETSFVPVDTAGAVISSSEPLIAAVEVSGAKSSGIYSAGGYLDSSLYAPKLDDGQDGWLSTIWAQNASGADNEIQMDFYDETGVLILSDSKVVSPKGIFKVATPTGADCAYIEANYPIAAAVIGGNSDSRYAYRARGLGYCPLIPLAMKNSGAWNTSITIQNPWTQDCQAYWRYLDQNGVQVGNDSESVVIPSDGAYTFSLEEDQTLSNTESFMGAVKLFVFESPQNYKNDKNGLSYLYIPSVVTHEKDGDRAVVSIGPMMGGKDSKDFSEEQSWGTLYGFPVIYQYAYEDEDEERDEPDPITADNNWSFTPFSCFIESLID